MSIVGQNQGFLDQLYQAANTALTHDSLSKQGLEALVHYRDSVNPGNSNYENLSYVGNLVAAEVGFIGLTILGVAETIVRLVLSLGFFAYDKIVDPQASRVLANRCLELAFGSILTAGTSIYCIFDNIIASPGSLDSDIEMLFLQARA